MGRKYEGTYTQAVSSHVQADASNEKSMQMQIDKNFVLLRPVNLSHYARF